MVYKNLYTLCFLYGTTEKKGKKKKPKRHETRVLS